MRYEYGNYDVSLARWWTEVLTLMGCSAGVSLAVVLRIGGKVSFDT